MTNEFIAANVRILRERLAWTQEQLADAARVNLRTIQRAEAAQGASKETLQALAGAMNVDVDTLRFDVVGAAAAQLGVSREEVTPELIERRKREFLEQHHIVKLVKIETSADLQVVTSATQINFDIRSKDDRVLDVASHLEQDLIDLMNVGRGMEAPHRRACEVETFRHISRLRELGCVMSYGVMTGRMRIDEGRGLPWTTLYLVVMPEADARDSLLIPRANSASS